MSRNTGNFYEQQTYDWLLAHDYKILEQNFSGRYGEIDLIAQDAQGVLCFVEVRYRKGKDYGGALASISRAKQQKIIKTAWSFLTEHIEYRNYPMRFDVFAWDDTQNPNIIFNAFSE